MTGLSLRLSLGLLLAMHCSCAPRLSIGNTLEECIKSPLIHLALTTGVLRHTNTWRKAAHAAKHCPIRPHESRSAWWQAERGTKLCIWRHAWEARSCFCCICNTSELRCRHMRHGVSNAKGITGCGGCCSVVYFARPPSLQLLGFVLDVARGVVRPFPRLIWGVVLEEGAQASRAPSRASTGERLRHWLVLAGLACVSRLFRQILVVLRCRASLQGTLLGRASLSLQAQKASQIFTSNPYICRHGADSAEHWSADILTGRSLWPHT